MSDELQCPHCGNVAIDTTENPSSVPWVDGDDCEIKCQSCGRLLTIVCQVVKIKHVFVDEYHDEIEFEQ